MGKRDKRDVRRWSASELVGMRVGIYARASDDAEDTETSVDAQNGRGKKWADSVGAEVVARYCDNDLSASRYATKERPDFNRLIKDVEAGHLDIVWFWTLSRAQRKMAVYAHFRDLCAERGVAWVIKRRLYDLNDSADRRVLNSEAGNAEALSDEISENVKLGLELAASRGRPHGPVIFGYRREYDNRRRYVGQFPDDENQRSPFPPHEEYNSAAIVREIFRRLADSDPKHAIKRDLERRGIPNPSGGKVWHVPTITGIAKNPAYLGKRVYRGEILDIPTPDNWIPVLRTEAEVATFYAAQTVLNSPERKNMKPTRAKHLVSFIAECDRCDRTMGTDTSKNPSRYICRDRHLNIIEADLDRYVRTYVDAYLAREDVRQFILAGKSDDPRLLRLRAEAERLRNQLEEYRQLAESGQIDPPDYARISQKLKANISEKEREAEEATVPPILRGLRVEWDDIAKARQAVAALVSIRVLPCGRGKARTPENLGVKITPKLGPDAP
ncbi:MAG TPA: recombinase family protein [Spirillospora sp.]|nr:recombinase family protein [Spirillospora sp.]